MPLGFSHIAQAFGDKPECKSEKLITPNRFLSLSTELENGHLPFQSGPVLEFDCLRLWEDEKQSPGSHDLDTQVSLAALQGQFQPAARGSLCRQLQILTSSIAVAIS